MLFIGIVVGRMSSGWAEEPTESPRPQTETERALPSEAEARGRAELLHESLHATLQAIHHRYFHEDEGIVIPAVTLKSVFRELARHRKVEVRWLAVNAQAMNVDHEPRDAFEKEAVKALAAGADSFESCQDGVYRRVGSITLHSECLKCHLPNRSSNDERLAGLLIAIPIKHD